MSWSRHQPRHTRAARARNTAVVTRDGGICYLCGQPGADTADHVIPLSQGGADHPANMAAVHDRTEPHCHKLKTQREAKQGRDTTTARLRPPPVKHPGLR